MVLARGVFLSLARAARAARFSCRCSQNAELFTLTYGAMVMQLIQDFEDVGAVNKQLESM